MLSNADVLNAEAGGEESGINQLTRAGLNFDEFEDEDDEDEEVAVINVTAFGYAEEEAHDDLGAALRASGYHVEGLYGQRFTLGDTVAVSSSPENPTDSSWMGPRHLGLARRDPRGWNQGARDEAAEGSPASPGGLHSDP